MKNGEQKENKMQRKGIVLCLHILLPKLFQTHTHVLILLYYLN